MEAKQLEVKEKYSISWSIEFDQCNFHLLSSLWCNV